MSNTGSKEKPKSRHRALVKMVLFIIRVQKSQKKRQRDAEQDQHNLRSDIVPLLRCSTVPTLPILLPGPTGVTTVSPSSTSTSLSGQDANSAASVSRRTSHRPSRDLGHWHHLRPPFRQASLLSVCDDNEERYGSLFLGAASNVSPYSRSRASSSVSRCSYNSKNSGGADSLSSAGGVDEDGEEADFAERRISSFVDFTNMHKPYTLNGCGDVVTSGVMGAKSGVKNITVTCNSVMGDPKKLSKRLIRRGSTTEARDDRFSVRPSTSGVTWTGASGAASQISQRQRKEGVAYKSPMIRQQTADSGRLKPLLHRCTSDENVAGVGGGVPLEADISPQTARKFVKRKSSADLLLMSCDATSGGYSTSTLDRISGLAAGVMMTSSAVSSQLSKAEKKKLEKMKENMKQLLELFTAVEQDDIGKVRSILLHGEVDVNATNMDELTLLDVATMLNHAEVALLLLKHGAQENQKLSTVAQRTKHLQALVDIAQAKLAELTLAASKQAGSSTASLGSSATLSKSLDKQVSSCESRLHTLKKMQKNLENSELPGEPTNVTLGVSSCTSLSVTFEPPDHHSVVVTKYRIEWSQYEDFHEIDSNICVYDLRRLEASIPNLRPGATYFVRVSAGMYKGFGEPASSSPSWAVPSSWRDIDQTSNRGAGRLEAITDLFHELRKLKKTDLWERIAYTGDAALKKKKPGAATFKSLFSSNVKFQRNPKRGVYLACILYKEDKVLCTVDDCLPVVEVDDAVPTPLGPDFQWFMKLSCAWEDMRSLHFDVDLANQSPSLLFRLKLLEAAAALQAGLGVQDLGRLHSTPIVDSRGVTVLVTVQYVHDSKAVQGLAVKWVHMNKLLKKQSTMPEKEPYAMDLLISGLLNFLNFYESTYIPLDRGLYLGYVKLHTSINQISIVVPENLPSVLPFVFIRDNPHVSKDEWEWLRVIDTNRVKDTRPSATQLAFHWSLASAARVLLNDLDVGDDQIASHRVYRLEVVEVHSDVSFILLVPSHDDVCLPPGQPRVTAEEKRGCVALPVPMFEVAHLCTYQPDFIALYCRLSVFLEFYSVVLQQLHRQTLNEEEAKTYRQLLDILSGHQHRLEEVWKAARWITSVVTAARDRQLRSSLPLSILFSYTCSDSTSIPELPKPISTTSVMAADGPASPSFRSKCNEADAMGGVRKRRPTATDCYENGAKVDSEPSTSSGVRPLRAQNRPRRVSSGEQSLSDQGEENSDVGYHSDQSVEKLANATAAATGDGDKGLAAPGLGSIAASNPTYDFPENVLQNRAAYVNREAKSEATEKGKEKTVLSAQNMDYFVNKLNFVQRTIPESSSKLIEVRYGRYDPPITTFSRGRLRSDESRPTECGTLKQSATSPAITYRTEIAVGDTGAPQSTGGAVFDVQFKTAIPPSSGPAAHPNRRNTHDYVNVPATLTTSNLSLLPRRKSGCVDLPVMSLSAASDSEASCSSTSTASSRSLQQKADPVWTPNEESNRALEDLSVIDKLYAEATSRLPSSSGSGIHTPTPTQLQKTTPSPRPPSSASSTRSAASSSSDRSRTTARIQSPQSGVLRVYAAYPCGLAKGTSVKLHVTPKTTAKEVVVLVVRQLNKAVEMKGLKGPLYENEELSDFVLVAVIGARERCLRDDFPPLELQNPWCKGKLFIRRRNDLLAALEFGNEAKV